jgi:hypothetical protein
MNKLGKTGAQQEVKEGKKFLYLKRYRFHEGYSLFKNEWKITT